MERVVSYAQKKLTDTELEFCKYMSPSSQKAFAKLSKHKRERMVSSICNDLSRKGYDVSEIQQPVNNSYIAFASHKAGARAISKPARALLAHKRNVRRNNYLAKRSAMITTIDGEVNRKLIREIANPTEKGRQKAIEKSLKSEKASKKQFAKDSKKFNKTYDKTNGKVMKKDKRLAKRQSAYKKVGIALDNHFKKGHFDPRSKTAEQTRKQIEQKLMSKLTLKFGTKGAKLGGKLMLKMMSLLIKLIAALVSSLITILPIVLIVVIVVIIISLIFSLFAAEEEEKLRAEKASMYGSCAISPEVEQYRSKILKEAKKYNYGEYIDLYLAVVQQESGGKGNDIFQCSESVGKKVGTLSVDASIKQGVKYLSGMMKRSKIKKVDDIPHIKIALQAYNMGGGYIDYLMSGEAHKANNKINYDDRGYSAHLPTSSKLIWTQASVLAFQKKKANGVERTGSSKSNLGPYKYGDAYYTEHVLRYYTYADGSGGKLNVKVGVASKVPKSQRINFLFGGTLPQSEAQMGTYKVTINVPIINEQGKKTTMALTVHKKLASEYKAIFEDMVKIKFQIKPSTTAAYNWRPIAGTNKLSQHSYGAAIDINWNDNPQLKAPFVVKPGIPAKYGKLSYDPKPRGRNKYALTQKVIAIWRAHGFTWGGDWLNNTDTMHFSYTE